MDGRIDIWCVLRARGQDVAIPIDARAASKLLSFAMISEGNHAPTFSYAEALIGTMRVMVAMATGLVLANTIIYWYISYP